MSLASETDVDAAGRTISGEDSTLPPAWLAEASDRGVAAAGGCSGGDARGSCNERQFGSLGEASGGGEAVTRRAPDVLRVKSLEQAMPRAVGDGSPAPTKCRDGRATTIAEGDAEEENAITPRDDQSAV